MPLARHLALLCCAAAFFSCSEAQKSPTPDDNPQMRMVAAVMNQQADLLEKNGQQEQASMTRKLAQQMEDGAFGSDPTAALAAARASFEQEAANPPHVHHAKSASSSQPDLQSEPAAQDAPAVFPQGGVVGGNRELAIGQRVASDPANSAPPVQALALTGRLAVLDLRNYASDLTVQNASYFTDVIRQETLRTQPRLQVMTRENLLVLLQASGKKIEDCEGECEVDTGRRIGADLIVSGEIQKLGTRYKISIRLHDTKEGRLLGSAIASGSTIDALDDAAAKAVKELYTTAH